MPATRNDHAAWEVTVDVANLTSTVGPNMVTVNSEHHFSLLNKVGEEVDFDIHYSLDLYEELIVNGKSQWALKGSEDFQKPYNDLPSDGVARTHLDAEADPGPDIPYHLGTACDKIVGRRYRAVAYTQIKPLTHLDEDWGDPRAIKFTREMEPFTA